MKPAVMKPIVKRPPLRERLVATWHMLRGEGARIPNSKTLYSFGKMRDGNTRFYGSWGSLSGSALKVHLTPSIELDLFLGLTLTFHWLGLRLGWYVVRDWVAIERLNANAAIRKARYDREAAGTAAAVAEMAAFDRLLKSLPASDESTPPVDPTSCPAP